MLLGRTGTAGLLPVVVERLRARSAGIITEAGVDYGAAGVPIFEVADLRQAVTDLATDARRQFAGTMIGVTGSVGKTSTVAMAAHALAGVGKSDRSRTSANSLYGIGWNLASMDRSADFWIQEMAAQRMETCARLVRPDVAIITAVAEAHTAYLGTLEDIARHKARIYRGMKPGGITVINADMAEVAIFDAQAAEAGLRVVRFGTDKGCDARLLDIDRSVVHVDIMGESCHFTLGAPGRHMAMNALAVLATAAALGRSVPAAAEQLRTFESLPGRGKRHRLVYFDKPIEVWDEAYNANPASMRVALQMMRDAGDEIPHESRVLILGDMLELGVNEQEMHLSLEADIRAVQPDRVLLCGPLMEPLGQRLFPDLKGRAYPDAQAILPDLPNWLKPKDVVLVKSSHGTGLGRIVTHLVAIGRRQAAR
jgi:UDP-N-acetylmuramoyl-tripeptide--D-alanyl-D-alanine ligase